MWMKTLLFSLAIAILFIPVPAAAYTRAELLTMSEEQFVQFLNEKMDSLLEKRTERKETNRAYERKYKELTRKIGKLERQRDAEIRSIRSGGTVSGARYSADSITRKYAPRIAKLWQQRSELKR